MSSFDQIAQKHHWTLKGEPTPLSGGFMHKMFKVDTDQGTYAIKLLNPFIMQRDTAMDNFMQAEQLETMLEKCGIPILPALSVNGRKMQETDGQYYYIFEFFPGKALKTDEVTEFHCRQMGTALARIHKTDRKCESQSNCEMHIDWLFYLARLKESNGQLYSLLKDTLPMIKSSQQNGNRARKNLPPIAAVCHNDMDCKNVLWAGEDYRIIDLECLSYNNPFMELFELALCWAGYEHSRIDFSLFQAFLRGYRDAGGEMPQDWETLYDCNNSRLEWLEYNIKRALGIDCGADEKEIGIQQTEETIKQIRFYYSMKNDILKHCMI